MKVGTQDLIHNVREMVGLAQQVIGGTAIRQVNGKNSQSQPKAGASRSLITKLACVNDLRVGHNSRRVGIFVLRYLGALSRRPCG